MRQEGMKKKWEKFSVEIQVVHIVIVSDQGGNKYNRYAMSKMYANEGMDKTTTCWSRSTFLVHCFY